MTQDGLTITNMLILANWGELADEHRLEPSNVTPEYLYALFQQLGCKPAAAIHIRGKQAK